MKRLLLVSLAGALGTATRYGTGLAAARLFGTGFPYGTLAVNVVGCFLIALVMELSVDANVLSETARVTLTTGFMGGLTTYSSFDYETMRFVDARAWGSAAGYVAVTLMVCFVSGWLGLWSGRALVSR